MRKYFLLLFDLIVVMLSPFIALVIRDDFQLRASFLEGLFLYALACTVISVFVMLLLGTHRGVLRFTSFKEASRILVAATLIIVLSLALCFVINRVDGIPRSVPLIQWAFIVSTLLGTRLAIRVLLRPKKRWSRFEGNPFKEHILVVGVNCISELYLRAVADLAGDRVVVEGLLDENTMLKGRRLQHHKVIGQPVDLPQILSTLTVHGVEITRIVITMPFEDLSEKSREALLHWESGGTVTLELFEEKLGFGKHDQESDNIYDETQDADKEQVATSRQAYEILSFGKSVYTPVKRLIDIIGAALLMLLLSPLFLLTALLVAADLGLPLIFWQQRPGLYGHPFRLYKFQTMGPAHDHYGNAIPDDCRLSMIGRFLRRTRLDELPQLYHVFIGEMSFVGPRPLLPGDIPADGKARFAIRPGVTGWAQVNGGHSVPAEAKMILDLWYIANSSFLLDMKIIIMTLRVAIFGEKISIEAIEMAEKANKGREQGDFKQALER
jgi:lipopolysaccharide/colanic/teichoic acid biosynthesis glycosyltransferase